VEAAARLSGWCCRFLLKAAETGTAVTLTREPSGQVSLCVLFGRHVPPADLLRQSGDRELAIEVARRLFSSPAVQRKEGGGT